MAVLLYRIFSLGVISMASEALGAEKSAVAFKNTLSEMKAATKTGTLFKNGELFETSFKSSSGLKIGALAETEIQGSTLTLKNITIYAEGTEIANTVGARSFIQLKNQVVQMAQQQGFTKIILQGERVMGSTSANPGKVINQVIDLTK